MKESKPKSNATIVKYILYLREFGIKTIKISQLGKPVACLLRSNSLCVTNQREFVIIFFIKLSWCDLMEV
ncbi:MAG: hypothetical protein EAZ20_05210 [Bacteroidetes bacterium]|nr:MAG: hypothetical protein EAZ20_05210 [Bacteroidota bacterium]